MRKTMKRIMDGGTAATRIFSAVLALLLVAGLSIPANLLSTDEAQAADEEELRHGTIEISCEDADDNVIELEVGETAEIEITPYTHYQYLGCLKSGCPDRCEEEHEGLECFIKGFGCKCDGTKVARSVDLSVTIGDEVVASVGEVEVDSKWINNDNTNFHDKTRPVTKNGTLTLTAEAVGTTTVTVECATDEDNEILHNDHDSTLITLWHPAEVTYTVVVSPESEHDLSYVEAQEASCLEDGNIAYYECSKCGAIFADAEATTELELEDVTIAAIGAHSWDEGTVTTQASCGESGELTYTCSVCGATCTEEIPATGEHSWDEGAVTAEPSCTEAGETTYTCTVCGATESEEIPATGHSLVHVEAAAATCVATGNAAYWECSSCGRLFADAEAVEEIQIADVTIAATGEHSWGEGSVTVEASCTEAGSISYLCTVCGEVRSEEVPATGHDWDYAGALWEWSDDCSSATATLTCQNDASHTSVVEATVVSQTEASGAVVYTATILDADGAEHSTTRTVEPAAEEPDEDAADDAFAGDAADDDAGDDGASNDDASTDDGVSDDAASDGSAADAESSSASFVDVPEGSYYHDAVYALVDLGCITGYSESLFGTGDSMTRAQFATILWRIVCPEDYAAYADDAANETSFADVSDDAYYTAAVNWAVENEVMTGYSASRFAPNGAISFEQMCLVVARCASSGESALEASLTDDQAAALLAGFADADEVSSWADKGMAFCVREGLVSGTAAGTLLPQQDVPRERAAVVLWRAIEEGLL